MLLRHFRVVYCINTMVIDNHATVPCFFSRLGHSYLHTKKTQWVQTLQTLYANLQQLNSKTTVPTISIHFENVKYNLFIQQLTYQNNHIKQTTYKYLTYWNVCHF